MAINTSFYGAESTWLTYTFDTETSCYFKVANFNTKSTQKAYKVAVAGKFKDKDSYFQDIDESFCWCQSDGSAPFDSITYFTGHYKSGAIQRNRLSPVLSSTSAIGLSVLPQILSQQYLRYYKSSRTGDFSWSFAPINYRQQFGNNSFTPEITKNNATYGTYAHISNGGIAPALKFDFGSVFYVPFITYAILDSSSSISSLDNASTLSNLQSHIQTGSRTDDLGCLLKRIENGTLNKDKVVITSIKIIPFSVKWNEDGTINEKTTIANGYGIACAPMSRNPLNFTFEDWFTEDSDSDHESYGVRINTSAVNNYPQILGTYHYYDEINDNIGSGVMTSVANAITVSGNVQGAYGTLSWNPDISCYNLTPCIKDAGNYTIKKWEDNNEMYTAYTSIGKFGDVDDFREYVRRCCAYFGGYFTECLYPNVTRDWLEDSAFIGTIDSGGTTHGDYTNGQDNESQPQRGWGDKWDKKTPFDPSKGSDSQTKPNPHEDFKPVTSTGLGFTTATGAGSLCYALTSTEFTEIWDDLYGMKKGKWKDLLEKLALFGANPLNAILSYRWYPCSWQPSHRANIVLGSAVVNGQHTYPCFTSANETSYYNAGTYNFAEEAPYGDNNFYNTQHETACIWLPFYGFYEIPITKLISEQLLVELYIDIPADTAQWIISFGGNIFDYVECVPYLDIPITGDNSTQIAIAKRNNMIQNSIAIGSAAVLLALSIGTAAPAIAELYAAGAATASITGGSLIGGMAANVAPLIGEGIISGASLAAGGSLLAQSVGKAAGLTQSISQQANQIGSLKTNVPHHSGSDITTFLHLPLRPILFWWRPQLFENFNKSQYMRTVGIATEQWSTIDSMPSDSLLSISNPTFDTSGMSYNEIQALKSALTGFFK